MEQPRSGNNVHVFSVQNAAVRQSDEWWWEGVINLPEDKSVLLSFWHTTNGQREACYLYVGPADQPPPTNQSLSNKLGWQNRWDRCVQQYTLHRTRMAASSESSHWEEMAVITSRYQALFDGLKIRSAKKPLLDMHVMESLNTMCHDTMIEWFRSMERDAVAYARNAWRVYLPDQNFDEWVDRIRDRSEPDVFRRLLEQKSKAPHNLGQAVGVHTCCSLFFCTLPAFQTINRLQYCRIHYGVALINARRHDCRACFAFNLLVLRNTPMDEGHIQNANSNLFVPLPQPNGSHDMSVRWWCNRSVWAKLQPGIAFQISLNSNQKFLDVSPNAFVFVPEGKPDQLVAWVEFQRLDKEGRWVAMRELSVAKTLSAPPRAHTGRRASTARERHAMPVQKRDRPGRTVVTMTEITKTKECLLPAKSHGKSSITSHAN